MLPNAELLAKTDTLNASFKDASAEQVLQHVLEADRIGKIAMVSSFGAESAVLLHMVAQINPRTPVLFVDTEFLFPETLDYLKTLAVKLGLKDIRRIMPDPARTAVYDPDDKLHLSDQDQCCHLRKTLPLRRALGEFAGWITGRKRYQSAGRADLAFFENDPVTNRTKVNPLIHWQAEDLRNYMTTHDLPRHPMVEKGYPSIGCLPCTSRVENGEDTRAGRWRGQDKDECGIHFADGKIVRPSDMEKT